MAVEYGLLTVAQGALGSLPLSGITAQEYASPLSADDLQGGVGSVRIETDARMDNVEAIASGGVGILSSPEIGRVYLFPDSVQLSDNASLSIDGMTGLQVLVAHKVLPAYSGTLSGALTYYLNQAGAGLTLSVDPELASIPVNLPPVVGDLWNHVKMIQAVYQFELAAANTTIVARKLRERYIDPSRYTSASITAGVADAVSRVRVSYYNKSWEDDYQVYPDARESINTRQIISVGAGEEILQNVPINMWPSTIHQPTQVLHLPWNNTSATSVYAVVDRDGVAVSPQDWQNGGGYVSYELGEDGQSVDITVRGMATNQRAPYYIASSSEDNEFRYAALYIAADGIAFDKKEVETSTAAPSSLYAAVDSEIVVDSPVIDTLDQAVTQMVLIAQRNSGVSQTFQGSSVYINRRGQTGVILGPTFDEYSDTRPPSETFTQFASTSPSRYTFDSFAATTGLGYETKFENQALGGMGGSRVIFRDAMYRLSSVDYSPGDYSWTAQMDTTFQDYEDHAPNPDKTFNEFSAEVASGTTFQLFTRTPLAA